MPICSHHEILFSNAIFTSPVTQTDTMCIGILKGEGVGSEVIDATLLVLDALEDLFDYRFDLHYGGAIGKESLHKDGVALSDGVIDFCKEIFSQKGAILCGPGGDRFVYDIRRQFDLFCKIVPLKSYRELGLSGRLRSEYSEDVDILLLRDNIGGIYQGDWGEVYSNSGGRRAEHRFFYTEEIISRLLNVAARIADQRKGKMTVAVKDSGIPVISQLWRDCSAEVSNKYGVACTFMNIDYMSYALIQHPQDFDVIVAPNLFGDILGDVGALLMGSRAVPCSGNFSSEGAAIYQTCHGTAYDLVGSDSANPVAQILSLSMLLKESFGQVKTSHLIESAIKNVWLEGWRTCDLMAPGYKEVGTRQMAKLIVEALTKE